MTRRGTRVRPTFGVHLSYYNTRLDTAGLITSAQQRPGIDPELGLIIEAPNHILVHALFRLDALGMPGEGAFPGPSMSQFGIGAGAHF